jgi:uncharacterized protein YlxP (DUF503 family)
MKIGLLQVQLFLPTCHSLKAKRSIVKRCINVLRKNYNVGVSEIADNDLWQSCWLGIVTLNSSDAYMEGTFRAILKELERSSDFQVADYEIQMF